MPPGSGIARERTKEYPSSHSSLSRGGGNPLWRLRAWGTFCHQKPAPSEPGPEKRTRVGAREAHLQFPPWSRAPPGQPASRAALAPEHVQSASRPGAKGGQAGRRGRALGWCRPVRLWVGCAPAPSPSLPRVPGGADPGAGRAAGSAASEGARRLGCGLRPRTMALEAAPLSRLRSRRAALLRKGVSFEGEGGGGDE